MYRENLGMAIGEMWQYDALPCTPRAAAACTVFGLLFPWSDAEVLIAAFRFATLRLRMISRVLH